jgi:hypothetical protein
MVSVISTIHVIDFFKLSNPTWLAVSLAIAFEVGAAASLASLISLDKMNKGMVWGLFIILTLMQAMGNTYYAYTHLQNFQGWIELFGLVEEELIYQKRILSIISGAVLPVVALGFIKSLVDYIKPEDDKNVIVEEIIVTEPQVSEVAHEEIAQELMVEDVASSEPDEIILDLATSENSDSFDDGYNEDTITTANTNRIPIMVDPTKL